MNWCHSIVYDRRQVGGTNELVPLLCIMGGRLRIPMNWCHSIVYDGRQIWGTNELVPLLCGGRQVDRTSELVTLSGRLPLMHWEPLRS